MDGSATYAVAKIWITTSHDGQCRDVWREWKEVARATDKINCC